MCHNFGMDYKLAFLLWYNLPDILPDEVKLLVVEYTFDPLTDPW